MTADLLTQAERDLVGALGKCAGMFYRVVGDGQSRPGDVREFVHHIHACQQQVMSQAAARAYPDEFRLLGGVIHGQPETAITIETKEGT